jgi:hypothetical protein
MEQAPKSESLFFGVPIEGSTLYFEVEIANWEFPEGMSYIPCYPEYHTKLYRAVSHSDKAWMESSGKVYLVKNRLGGDNDWPLTSENQIKEFMWKKLKASRLNNY